MLTQVMVMSVLMMILATGLVQMFLHFHALGAHAAGSNLARARAAAALSSFQSAAGARADPGADLCAMNNTPGNGSFANTHVTCAPNAAPCTCTVTVTGNALGYSIASVAVTGALPNQRAAVNDAY